MGRSYPRGNAIIGNGSILATCRPSGEIDQLFWPHIDQHRHTGPSWAGISLPGENLHIFWLHQQPWIPQQDYVPATNILTTTYSSAETALVIEQTDWVRPADDVLVRRFKVKNTASASKTLRMVYYWAVELGEVPRYGAMFYHEEDKVLVHYRNNTYFAIGGTRPPDVFRLGRRKHETDPLRRRRPLDDRATVAPIGQPAGLLIWYMPDVPSGGSAVVTVLIAAARDEQTVLNLLRQSKQLGSERLFEETHSYWHSFLIRRREIQGLSKAMDDLYQRSLLAMALLSDRESGALLAAPEIDPDYRFSGGYGYCWGRDAVYIAYALGLSGYPEFAAAYYRFACSAQDPSGLWKQRHNSSGAPASRWGMQLDETGIILWGMWEYYILTGDHLFLSELWPCVRKAADALVLLQEPDTGLPVACDDLWEEESAVHAYTAAAIAAGLFAASQAATFMPGKEHEELAVIWREAARRMSEGIYLYFWDKHQNSWLRSLRQDQHIQGNIVDASLLGLIFPFSFHPPGYPANLRVLEEVEKKLADYPAGGIGRYPKDRYIGGNPWILTTLWLSIAHARTGNHPRALALLEWAVAHVDHVGLLSEQVHKQTGQPVWVSPLAWSHAMYLIALTALQVRQEVK